MTPEIVLSKTACVRCDGTGRGCACWLREAAREHTTHSFCPSCGGSGSTWPDELTTPMAQQIYLEANASDGETAWADSIYQERWREAAARVLDALSQEGQ